MLRPTKFQHICMLYHNTTTTLIVLTYCYFHYCLHAGAPQITVSAPSYVIQGDTLTVNCSVTSFPQSSVSLSLGDTPLMTNVSEVYDPMAGSFSYFTTHSTTAMHPSDEGSYTCSANITHGQPAVTEMLSNASFVAVYGGSHNLLLTCSNRMQNETPLPHSWSRKFELAICKARHV